MAVQRFSASLNLNEYRDVSIKVTNLFFSLSTCIMS